MSQRQRNRRSRASNWPIPYPLPPTSPPGFPFQNSDVFGSGFPFNGNDDANNFFTNPGQFATSMISSMNGMRGSTNTSINGTPGQFVVSDSVNGVPYGPFSMPAGSGGLSVQQSSVIGNGTGRSVTMVNGVPIEINGQPMAPGGGQSNRLASTAQQSGQPWPNGDARQSRRLGGGAGS